MNLPDRVEELINAILDGEASGQEIQELQSLVEDDPVVASTLADRLVEHRLLGYLHQPFDAELCTGAVMDAIESSEATAANAILDKILDASSADGVESSRETWNRRIQPMGMFVAAAAVCLLFVGTWGVLVGFPRDRDDPGRRATESDPGEIVPVATVLLQENCVWTDRVSLSEGERLDPGILELTSGTAVMRFDGGAELIMVGPAVLDLASATRVRVHLGDVVVRADDGVEGFVVLTPTSEVIDLGTEFAVNVSDTGKTEVHVLDGQVSYRRIDAAAELAKLLQAGEGIAIDEEGGARAIPMNSPRFKEFVKRINPQSRADLLMAYEGFNYSPGSLPLEQSDVGMGWDGPWRRRLPEEQWIPTEDTTPEAFEIVHGQLNVSWPVPGGRLGMLKLPPGKSFYVRPLRDAIDLSEDGVTYFSLMVREIERTENQEPPYDRVRITFRSSEDYNGDALSFGHGQRYRPRIRAGKGILFTSPIVFPAEQTTLWIGKILARAGGEDEVYFRIYGENEKLDYAEPATWHVVTRALNSDAKLDRVLMSSTGSSGRIIDELRIGPTYRSVAPMSESTP